MSLTVLGIIIGLCVFFGQALFVTLGILSVLCWNLIVNSWQGFGPALENTALLFVHAGELEKDLIVAIPLFTLAGTYLTHGKTSERLVEVMRALMGWLPGGLALACILACCFFAAISGSSAVTIIAVGGMLYPALQKAGYSRRFALGLLTACGAIGTLVVPALPLVAYSVFASNAVPGTRIETTDLYLAGALPTLAAVGVIGGYCVVLAIVKKLPRDPFSVWGLVKALFKGFFAVCMPILLIYLLFSGTATIVETSAVAVLYALIVELPTLGFKKLGKITVESSRLIGSIVVIMAMANSLSNFLTDQEIPQLATDVMRFTRVQTDADPEPITGELVYEGEDRLVVVPRLNLGKWTRAIDGAKTLGFEVETLGDLVALHRGVPLEEALTDDSESAFEDLDELREDGELSEKEQADLEAVRAAFGRLKASPRLGAETLTELKAVRDGSDDPLSDGELSGLQSLTRSSGLKRRAWSPLVAMVADTRRAEHRGWADARMLELTLAVGSRALEAISTREELTRGFGGAIYELSALRRLNDRPEWKDDEKAALTRLIEERQAYEDGHRAVAKLAELDLEEVEREDVTAIHEPRVKTKLGFLLGVNLLLLAVGCVMDIFSGIIVMAPLIVPIAVAYDVNLVHLGIVFAMNLEIGFATPPFGINLFISQSFFRRSLTEVFVATLPFLLMLLGVLGLVTYWEPLSMWLVGVFGTGAA